MGGKLFTHAQCEHKNARAGKRFESAQASARPGRVDLVELLLRTTKSRKYPSDYVCLYSLYYYRSCSQCKQDNYNIIDSRSVIDRISFSDAIT